MSGTIPESIGQLVLLQELFLGSNYLSGELPVGICDLENLEYLGISDTLVEGIFSSKSRLYTRMHWESLSIVVS
jgi:Leucine-rich repeat (LRR) protein